MAVRVVHATQALGADAGNGEIHKAQWNEDHTVTGLAAVATSGAYSDLAGTPSIPTAANPTATIGTSAVNGSASTFMRSDAAPALDQTAAYAFSGLGATKITSTLDLPTTGGNTANGSNAEIIFGTRASNPVYINAFNNTIYFGAVGQNVGLINTARLGLVAGLQLAWTNNTTVADGTADFIITRGGVATGQLGAANAASPVAQTLQAQGSRAGTDSNVGGANLTVTAGNGTGTGAISSLILQSPVAAASGTGAQTQTTGLTVKGGQAVLPSYTVATLPTGIKGGMAAVTDGDASLAWGATVVNSGAGATYYQVNYNGSNWTVVGK